MDGLMRDRRPAEGFLDAPPSCIAEAPTFLRIIEKLIDRGSEIVCELFGIGREACIRVLIERNQVACLSVNHHFLDASRSAGNHWSAACHGLKIDNAERLVYRRTAEHASVAVKLNHLRFCDHFLYPHNTRVVSARIFDLLSQRGSNLRGIRGASAKHYLRVQRKIPDRVDQMCDSLLLG